MERPTKETVLIKFNELIAKVEDENKSLKRSIRRGEPISEVGPSLVEFISFLVDDIKELKKDVKKISKKTRTKNWVPSGIFKEVGISNELAKFTGWEIDSKHSRVDTYSFIYSYIHTNKLNQVGDRRDIIDPDVKLKHLLGYNEDSDGPLKFFHVQEYLKRQGHFIEN